MKNQDLLSRRGRFRIPVLLIENEDLESLFGTVIVVRCEHIYIEHAFRYHALSKQFDIVEEFNIAPEYEAIFENNTFMGWKKVEQIV